MKKYKYYHFQIPITFDCNLKCKNCLFNCDKFTKRNAFYITIEKFKEYLTEINRIVTNSNIPISLTIFGGEPLLHPNVIEFLNILYDYKIRVSDIFFSTNGIKLLSMPDSFFTIIKKLDAVISISKYPININYDNIFKYVQSNHCKIENAVILSYKLKNTSLSRFTDNDTMVKFGEARFVKDKIRTEHYCADYCCFPIYDDKIFVCAAMLREYIKQQIFKFPPRDIPYINLKKINNFEQIIDFIENDDNMEICEHCKWKEVKWQASKTLTS